MRRFNCFVPTSSCIALVANSSKSLLASTTSARFCATTANPTGPTNTTRKDETNFAEEEGRAKKSSTSSSSTSSSSSSSISSQVEEPKKQRNIRVFSNTAKGLYVHVPNLLGQLSFITKDLPVYFWGFMFLFVGSQVYVRLKVAKRQTAESAKLGESLLDNRTRDLLGDVENLRNKDPLRLESEANLFHEIFWKRRAKVVSEHKQESRTIEIARGEMQGVARGTDMSEWLGAKKKDEQEREVARRTHDYIQGFHQHLKAKRLI